MIGKYGPDHVKLQSNMLEDFHALMLEALRHREQDVIRYIAILAPALGGYIWLLINHGPNSKIFATGTLGVIFLLLTGATYACALGYNYRYITLQLAKLETLIDIRDFILAAWPGDAKVFAKKYGRYCVPPEVIKIFWLVFIFAIAGVSISAATQDKSHCCIIVISGLLAISTALILPLYYGDKLEGNCCETEWKPLELRPYSNNAKDARHNNAL